LAGTSVAQQQQHVVCMCNICCSSGSFLPWGAPAVVQPLTSAAQSKSHLLQFPALLQDCCSDPAAPCRGVVRCCGCVADNQSPDPRRAAARHCGLPLLLGPHHVFQHQNQLSSVVCFMYVACVVACCWEPSVGSSLLQDPAVVRKLAERMPDIGRKMEYLLNTGERTTGIGRPQQGRVVLCRLPWLHNVAS
jgi:hypothetical protein